MSWPIAHTTPCNAMPWHSPPHHSMLLIIFLMGAPCDWKVCMMPTHRGFASNANITTLLTIRSAESVALVCPGSRCSRWTSHCTRTLTPVMNLTLANIPTMFHGLISPLHGTIRCAWHAAPFMSALLTGYHRMNLTPMYPNTILWRWNNTLPTFNVTQPPRGCHTAQCQACSTLRIDLFHATLNIAR